MTGVEKRLVLKGDRGAEKISLAGSAGGDLASKRESETLRSHGICVEERLRHFRRRVTGYSFFVLPHCTVKQWFCSVASRPRVG